MIEAELKAHVRELERVRHALGGMSGERVAIYHDTYYDWPSRSLTIGDQEVRVRVETSGGATRCLLTFKSEAVDVRSQSKPEMETEVASPAGVDAILRGLGLEPFVSFEKRCSNFPLVVEGRKMLATLVRVPELDGTWLEVETMVDHKSDLVPALDIIRQFMHGLGIGAADLTTETYTAAVVTQQGRSGAAAVDIQ